jgi:hypothetical protein
MGSPIILSFTAAIWPQRARHYSAEFNLERFRKPCLLAVSASQGTQTMPPVEQQVPGILIVLAIMASVLGILWLGQIG